MMPLWVSQYVGIPYAELDCWGLVRRVMAEQWGIDLPDWHVTFRGVKRETILLHGLAWQEVRPDEGCLGDLVAITHGGWVAHVGLVVAPGTMLHTLINHDSVIERYDGFLFAARVSGLYRHPVLAGQAVYC